MRKMLRRLHFLLNRRRLEKELEEEMAMHREMMPEERKTAFGRATALREDAREVWAWMWLDRLWQDVVFAVRVFRRSPGFTLGAIAVLALGIGANLAELHVFDALLLHRLNIEGADRIFSFRRNSRDVESAGFPFAAVEFLQKNCSECAMVVSEDTRENVVAGSDSDRRANFVSGNYFAALRILPAWGRLLNEADATYGAPAVAVMGYQCWRDQYGADRHVVNRLIRINGKPVQIVGVAPYDFDGLSSHSTAFFLPVSQLPLLVAGTPPLGSFARSDQELYGRPKPGVTVEAVQAQFTGLLRELARREPSRFRPEERVIGNRLPGSGLTARRLPPAVFLLLFLVFLILLSACANLANMLLARGLERQKEIDTRIALGAGRARVVRQLLTENLLLALLGTAAGLATGFGAARYLVRALDAPPTIRIGMDWQMLVCGGAIAVISVLAFGLPPALQLTRGRHKSGRRRQVLVAVQVAVSCLLLIASAVVARNAVKNARVELGFDYQNMIVVYPSLLGQKLAPAVARQKLDAIATRLEQMPGADAVTIATMPPLGQRYVIDTLANLPPVYMNAVAPSYFASMKIPLIRGRSFLPGEDNAVLLSEAAARAVFPNQDPLGKAWNIGAAPHNVVGIVKDSGANLVVDSSSVEAYIPIDAAHAYQGALIVHSRGDVGPLVRSILLESAAGGEPLSAMPMRVSRHRILGSQEKMVKVIGSLGAIATALAAAGMFALVAFTVSQRTREIGIRMAIGAQPADVLRTLLAQNIAPVAWGSVAGVVLGCAVARLARSMVVVQDDPLDPISFAAGLAAFLVIALLATLSPAMKALRIDPSSTLRCE